jgi:hypothetical protein
MAGYTTDADKQIHWLFDEVKLMNGVIWCARNNKFRGFCCGTKGGVEDLKEMLVELLCDTDGTTSTTPTTKTSTSHATGQEGIYCNQWLARNPFGTTLFGEFFYNKGNLDGS